MAAPQPTLATFLAFVRNVMRIDAKKLPDASPWLPIAFANALAIVNPSLAAISIPQADAAGVALNTGGLTIYSEAVYNLAAHNLIEYAQDQPGFGYFKALRKKLNIAGFVSGVVQSSGDEGTSVSLVVQEAAKAFTLMNLQQLKTPYGRTYLGLAQGYGPTTWGIT
jgi:hypothetical protein